MGSSNMDVVTTGDVEVQRDYPNWFVNHKHMLRPNREGEAYKLGYVILKVPECARQPPQEFSPRGWRFGLHNRENLDSSGSEAVKLDIAVHYGLVGERWVDFCDAIVDDPRAMLACYGLQNGVTSWTDEQIKHVLALDALFLATYIDMSFPENERQLWTYNMMASWFAASNVVKARFKIWVMSVHDDLCQVENQIPFVLIDKVVEYMSNFVASPTFEGNDSQYHQRSVEYAINDLANCFLDTSGEAFKIHNSSVFNEETHLLGAAYKAICGSKGLSMKTVSGRAYICILSATKLKQFSIKIVGVVGPLCSMSYKKKCLHLPKVRIYDCSLDFAYLANTQDYSIGVQKSREWSNSLTYCD